MLHRHQTKLMLFLIQPNLKLRKSQKSPAHSFFTKKIEPALEIMVLITKATSEGAQATSSPTGRLHMHIWRMSLRRTQSTIISWRVFSNTYNVFSWLPKVEILCRLKLCQNSHYPIWDKTNLGDNCTQYDKDLIRHFQIGIPEASLRIEESHNVILDFFYNK